MHKLFFVFVMLLGVFGFTSSKAQIAPLNNGIFFQAVARDNFSNPAKDRTVFVEASIIQNAANGTKVLTEFFQTTTDGLGVFSLNIGSGTRIGGTLSGFDKIDWANGPYFLGLKIAIKPLSPVTNWDYTKELIDLGASLFGTVPYSFYSAAAATVKDQVKTTDTAAMLLPYAKKTDLALKVNLADSTTIYVTPSQLRAVKFDTTSIYAVLNQKEILANKSTNVATDATSDTKYPSVRAVKSYVDLQFSNFIIADGSVTTAKLANGSVTDIKIVSVAGSKVTGDIAGNAATATLAANAIKLATPRTINGIAFDGSSNITIATGSNPIDADANTKGVVQLTGDLTGTATQPRIANGAVTNAKIADVAASKITGAVAVANGGTGATTAAGARTNLGLVIGTDVLAQRTFGSAANNSTTDFIAATDKGANNGVATLGNDGKIPSTQIPAISFQSASVVANQAAMLTLTNQQVGSIAIRTDNNKNYVLSSLPATTLANWIELATPSSVTSVNGNAGPNVVLTATDIAGVELASNKSNDVAADAASTSKFPTVKSIKDYVDQQSANAGVADNSITSAKINGAIAIAKGGTGATTAAGARTNLGLVIGTDIMSATATTTLTGDVTGSGNGSFATTVNSVGGVSSSTIATLPSSVNANTASITAEITRATNAEAALDTRITSNTASITANTNNISSLTTSVNANTASITAEITRATNAEVALDTRVTSNTASITTNANNISSLTTSVNANTASITAEITRATNAEAALDTRVTSNTASITAEVTRATNADAALDTRITSNTASITAEITRATNAEAALDTRVTSNTASITANSNNISSLTTSVNANTASITAEITRATNAEAALDTRVTSNTASITAEVTRATNSETALDTRITSNTASITANSNNISSLTTSVNANTASITAEVTRATNAEAALDTRINSNTASITANTNNISSLTTSVNANTASITAEITRATNAEAALDTRVASNTTSITTNTADILLKAPINSPTFTGTPTGPTPATSDNSTQLATTAYVKSSITAANAGLSSIGSISGTSNAKGATISGTTELILTPADATNGGIVTTGSQTFAGAKTFSATTTFNDDIKVNDITIGVGRRDNSSITSTALGKLALGLNTTGSGNTALGQLSMSNNTTGGFNSASGSQSLGANTTGSFNTAFGNQALSSNTTGTYNTAIGFQANVSLGNLTNSTAIGNGAIAGASNTIQLGNSNVTSVVTSGTISATGFTGPLTGNSSTATKLAAGKTISLTGDVTYTSPLFDGLSDVTAAATLTNTNVTAGSYGSSTAIPTFTVDSKGRLTAAGTVGITAGVSTLAYSSTSAANGGTISGTTLTLAAADGTNPGLISIGSQTINGAKTFSSDVTAPNFLGNATTATTAGNITATSNTTLTSLSNLNTVGTITSGTWSGTTIAVANGGTGRTSITDGQILFGNGTSALGTNSNLMWNNTDGSFGIGTSSPGSGFNTKLDVVGNSSFRMNGINRALKFDGYSPSGSLEVSRIYTDATSGTPADFVLGTYPNGHLNQLYLKQSNGFVGIRNSSPASALDVNGTVTATTFSGTLTGNASSATALATGRTISTTGDVTFTSGAFDGTSNVTGSATLTNTTVTAGTYGSSTAIPTFTVDSKGRLTAASTVGITAGVSTLAYSTSSAANGGTISGTTLTLTAADASNPGLVSTGAQTIAGAKTFNNDITAPNFLGNASTATNIAGGAIGSIPYQSAAGITAILSGNTSSTVMYLTSSGNGTVSTAPTWVAPSFVPYTGATSAVNLGSYDMTVNGLTVGVGKNGKTVTYFNTSLGSNALSGNNSGVGANTAIGSWTLKSNTSGAYNTGIGFYALQANTLGSDNTAIGYFALGNNNSTTSSEASYNSAFGSNALENNTTGYRNSAFGYGAIRSNTTGNYNSGFGFGALSSVSSGSFNTAIGVSAGNAITTGDYNIFIGSDAGKYISSAGSLNSTGNKSVLIGYDVRPNGNAETNQIVISGYNGSGTVGLGSHSTLIGNSSTTTTQIMGDLTLPRTTTSTSATTGALKVAGGTGIAGALNVGGTTTLIGAATISNTTTSTSTSTGALIVRGGVGVAGSLNVGGNTVIAGTIEIDGGSPGAGKVLTSDANGVASWTYGTSSVSRPTTTGNILISDKYVFYDGLADGTLTLPAATGNAGKEIIIKNRTSRVVTVSKSGSETIYVDVANPNVTSFTIGSEASNNWVKLVSDGSNWVVFRALF